MLEVTHGQTRNQVAADELVALLIDSGLEGSLYIGYPIVATADDFITVDALLVTQAHGLVAFVFSDQPPAHSSDISAWRTLSDEQDQLFVAVENTLRRHNSLRSRRRLAVDVHTFTIVPDASNIPPTLTEAFADVPSLLPKIQQLPPISENFYRPLQAALQRVSTIRPPKRRQNITSLGSKGATIRQIESEIANLDQWQKRAAIESPEGPQRIRGLAGSGKTIVLALKAAYLHAQHPEWNIAVTFFSRALYQQFRDLVRRFSFEHSNDEPNWERLRILHAWGGRSTAGLYQQIALRAHAPSHNFLYARNKYGMADAFHGICGELLAAVRERETPPMFDAVLIDEAQDLPVPFFRLIHRMTHEPKRIVWAYDELQQLTDTVLPTLEEQFGTTAGGRSLVTLNNPPNAAHQDVVLPICYRNTPWALTLAHGLGLGTARDEGLVQSFDDPSLWTKVGYHVVQGQLSKGSHVVLERAPSSYPQYFSALLSHESSVECRAFDDSQQQAIWVADEIRRSLDEEELEHDDILIVLPNTYRAKSEASDLERALRAVGLDSHLVGVNASQDEVFVPQSIAMANIHRSKGNECPLVFVVNAQHCYSDSRLAAARNILFTAITRSKAWVKLVGWGPEMEALKAEADVIRTNGYQLEFDVPTDEELEQMRRLHQEVPSSEEERIRIVERELSSALEALQQGDVSIHDLPAKLRTAIARQFGLLSYDPE